jgi:hypothetical protein
MSKVIARCGTTCPIKTVGNLGIVTSHICIDLTFRPSGMLMVKGFVVTLLLTTSTASIMKMDVAPVSAIACVDAIVMAFKYLFDGWPNKLQTKGNGGGVDRCELLDQFKVPTVTSLLSKIEAKKIWWGPKN